ncbi:4-(cytidine 5'-diphospho)-2-C-methyl-D-erythritol kinase [Deinococcus aquiradiocola]|uniref:4-diphosphocytidyl-2-C-methyl-D-erythritol kinase n=1 Tax=Deinococcus aquiradiocola TaxID=393059 RepID=A0A917UPV6_9DEIO|nr:4-(cytidine 5'-diphospho)-2-C-methyl-D-erythritol kinase [Deinococcus aquiradiocola]GGJ74323.1 4-diphosphocytidyl-2-C-methyl-D-erythritol kinase [Deinococcus aquiradiocola]
MGSALRVFAPAKINLGLSVLGIVPRGEPHAGYHRLHTLMVPLDVGDTLSVAPAGTLTLEVRGADLPTDDRNLVYRAARAYLDAAGLDGGAHIVLEKRLPLAAGLGGGSSDAAGTLLALARLRPAGVDLERLAVQLGADVPFFLTPGAALVEGIGERRTPVALQPLHLVLLNPGTAVSAADAYRWLDDAGTFTPPLDVGAVRMAQVVGLPLPYLNALQPGVTARHPEIAEALSALAGAGLHSALMSGSGSTCFALAASRAQAEEAASALQQDRPDWWVRAASSV